MNVTWDLEGKLAKAGDRSCWQIWQRIMLKGKKLSCHGDGRGEVQHSHEEGTGDS